jgi:predicted permease
MSPRTLFSRLTAFMTRRGTDAALEADIQAHLDLLTHEYVQRGLSPEDARAAARKTFGGVEQMKETYRDQRGIRLFDEVAQDIRYGARMLRRQPAFTIVAVLSLGLGIGASTAAFSVFNAVMLRPMPVPDPNRLVQLQPLRQGQRFIFFNPIFEEIQSRQTTLSGMFAVNDAPFFKVTFDDGAAPAYVRASLVSGSYFSTLAVTPTLGRLLTDRDDVVEAAGSDCAAVISDRFWVRRFQRDPAILTRTLHVGHSTCAIVGVTPASFESHIAGFATDVWLPLRRITDPALLKSRGMAFFSGVMGRLGPGVEEQQAEAQLTTLFQQAQASQPPQPKTTPQDFTIHLTPAAQGLDTVRREFSRPLLIVLAVVAAVLLIASVNVANLLLSRGAARLPELATRAALGAGRGRLVRQLATEGAMLAVLGGIVGAGLAWLAIPLLASQVSLSYTTIRIDAGPDTRVVIAALVMTAAAALLAAVLPAVRLSHATLGSSIARETRSSTGSGQRLARVLVAGQLALSLLLVSAAGLLLRSMAHLAAIDPGFEPNHVVVLEVRDEAPRPPFGGVDSDEQKASRAARYQVLDERLNAIPAVRAASVSWLGLFSMNDLWLPLIDADRPDDRPLGRVDYVSPRYFDTMGMQILRGRGFTADDREGTPRVAVVNEALVRARFAGRDPLGRRLALDYKGEQDRPFTIVGIVRDSKYSDLREQAVKPMMWMPIAQAPFAVSSISLRTLAGNEAAVAREAENVLRATDRDVMVRRVTTLSAQVAGKTSRERLLLGLSSGFGALAVLLAAVGLYGTLAYAVSRRTREIGVRLALGASRRAVLKMVLLDAVRLTAVALAVGVPLTLATGSALKAFLFGVTPNDPLALTTSCAVLTIAALLAAFLPARRAAAVDPLAALRCE